MPSLIKRAVFLIYNYKKAQSNKVKEVEQYNIQSDSVQPETDMMPDANIIPNDGIKEEEEIPVITEDDVYRFMVDEIGDEPVVEEIEQEVPIEVTEEELPEFGNTQEALTWAINNGEVVRINYVTKKGIDIARIVEPHAFITPKTGNLIIVAYDRSVRNIRAFIVDNILNYIFTGKEFKPRLRVLPNKEKIAMENNIFIDLKNIGDELESKNLIKSAEVVTNSMSNILGIKKAQYVGVQGYWLRNRRCWDNCYRHKRTTEPSKPAQEVWMNCWDEYRESINNDESGWEKYAKDNGLFKAANTEQKQAFKTEQDKFSKEVEKKVAEGMSIGNAVYSTIKQEDKKVANTVIDNANALADLSTTLVENGYKEIGEKLANLSFNIIKEADMGYADGGGENFLNMFRNKGNVLNNRIFIIKQRIKEILKMIHGGGSTRTQAFNLSQIVKLAQLDDAIMQGYENPQIGYDEARMQNIPNSQNTMKGTPNQQALLKNVTNKYLEFVSDANDEIDILTEFGTKKPELFVKISKISQALTKFVNDSNASFQSEGGYSGRSMSTNLNGLLNTINSIQSMRDSNQDKTKKIQTTPAQQSQIDNVENSTTIANLRSLDRKGLDTLAETLKYDTKFPLEQLKSIGQAFLAAYHRKNQIEGRTTQNPQ